MKHHCIKLLLLSLILTSCNLVELYTDFNDYEKYINKALYSDEFMPKKEEIQEYSGVSVYYLYKKLLSHAITLLVTYDIDNYETAKEQLFANYQIIKETKEKYGPVSNRIIYYISPIVFNYKQFKINVVENSSFEYSKNFGMVGYSDETNSLCYMYWFVYDSFDLELTNDQQLSDFINEYYYFE